jgi:hypothetical protein
VYEAQAVRRIPRNRSVPEFHQQGIQVEEPPYFQPIMASGAIAKDPGKKGTSVGRKRKSQ